MQPQLCCHASHVLAKTAQAHHLFDLSERYSIDQHQLLQCEGQGCIEEVHTLPMGGA